MNIRGPEPLDVTEVTRDALLLDALGRGEPAPPGDDLAAMLAAWRTDLASTAPEPVQAPAAPVVPLRRRRHAIGWRVAVAAAAAVVGLAGTLTIAASTAGPGSPLWPITRLVYEDRADARLAEQDARRAIAAARDAIDVQRYADAGRHLDEATVLIGRIRDPEVAGRLRDEVASLRAQLPVLPAPGNTPSPPAGTAPGPGGGAGSTGGPGGGGDPAPTGGGGPVPGLPVPSLPLPTLPLPSLPPLPPLPPVLGG